MPNYRQKNKNKRNKNRNKNNNNNNSKDDQEQQQEQQQPTKKNATKQHDAPLLQQQQQQQQQQQPQQQHHLQQHVGVSPIVPATQSSNDDDLITSRIAPPAAANNSNHCASAEFAANCRQPPVAAKTATAMGLPISSTDTVIRDSATEIVQRASSSCSATSKKVTTMGAGNSKESAAVELPSISAAEPTDSGAEMRTLSITHQQGQVIVHRVIQQGTASSSEEEGASLNSQLDDNEPKLIVHAAHNKLDEQQVPLEKKESKVIIHEVSRASPENETKAVMSETKESKIIIHEILRETTDTNTAPIDSSPKVIVHKVLQQDYRVESPQPSPTKKQHHTFSGKVKKSRSLDDEEAVEDSELQIQEMSDNSSGGETDNPPLITEAESTDEDYVERAASSHIISIQTLPMEQDECVEDEDEEYEDDEELNSTGTGNRENYKQRRAQKRAALENHFLPQFLSPRYLDSIKEENSDMSDARSENSDLPLSRSASGNFDDEHDLDEPNSKAKKANAVFPRSHLDFSRKHKHGPVPKAPTLPNVIREETVPMVVEAKLIEPAPIAERCSSWSSGLTPESEAAEVVYINSASSSVSDLLELDYEEGAAGAARATVDLDTDVHAIFAKPNENAIGAVSAVSESANTETSELHDNQRESTPVNQMPATATLLECTKQLTQNMSTTTTMRTTRITNEQTSKHNGSEQSSSSSEQLIETILASDDDTNNNNNKNTSRVFANCEISTPTTGASTTLPASCESIAKPIKLTSAALTSNTQMNDLREILKTSVVNASVSNGASSPPITPHRAAPPPPPPVKGAYSLHDLPTQPPPVPPPPQSYEQHNPLHSEDVAPAPVFRIGAPISAHNFSHTSNTSNTTSNTAQPPTAASTSPKPHLASFLTRQESADSHCSDSTTHSQCTAINMGSLPHCDWADFDEASSVSGGITTTTDGEQSYNLESSDDAASTYDAASQDASIKKLRLLCTETLAALPYGEDILVELANVAQNIGESRANKACAQQTGEMPYPLPVLPQISDIQVPSDPGHLLSGNRPSVSLTQVPPAVKASEMPKSPSPPPVPAPPNENAWIGLPTVADPKLLVCLSPSQRSYMAEEKTATQQPDQLLDAHKKFIERRGYHEYSSEQVNAINSERAAEHKIVETAAMMKKLRESLTPPPPIPPPPVPTKSVETMAKTQQQQQQQKQQQQQEHEQQQQRVNGTGFGNANEHNLFADEEENKHRLLAIIHDTNEAKEQNQQQKQSQNPSSHENNSRQTSDKPAAQAAAANSEQKQTPTTTSPPAQQSAHNLAHFANSDTQRKESSTKSSTSCSTTKTVHTSTSLRQPVTGTSGEKFPQILPDKMQTIDNEFARVFPAMSHSDIFDQKRFSNIEKSGSQAPYCSQLLSTQPKRYSNIETSSFESKKRIENGRVVYDVSDSKRESFVDGEKPNGNSLLHFPVKEPTPSTTTPTTTEATQWPPSVNAAAAQHTNIGSMNGKVAEPPAVATSNVGEIMSALNLNTSAAAPTHADAATHSAASNTTTTTTKTEETHEKSEKSINSQHSENSTFNKNISSTYEEFRQRAKAAAEAAATATTPFTAPAMTTSDHKQSSTSSSSSVFHFDHEKLFKDFDDLSKQLNVELEHGKAQKEQREKSASLYDLSRMQTESKTRFDELKRQRHDHMQELEREIERSRRSRQFRVPMQLENDPSRRQSMPRTFEIPIRIENGEEHQAPASAPVTNEHEPRTYEIPVHVEPHYTVTSPMPMPADYADAARFRRAESMFNLTDNQQHQQHYRQRTSSNSQTDDWTRYASDLGSSENITRPFAREVEICYQRCRPQVIRAPRMSVSTNDLSSTTSQSQSYDAYNAYNVRRTHAPMLSQVPQKSKPQYLSCHSMIERNPNPTYISTTSRRGVSPAPATPTSPAAAPYTAADNSRDGDVRQRRASLPREIHEQQLKYIASKEQELKTEFERLENERRRLLEEMQRAPAMPVSPRVMRESYRPAPKLPTLSEDEVFRQQMAEEWLSKVAEREERRLHKIIKISKINEEAAAGLNLPAPPACPKVDIGDEFLKRVKERRSKLAMPSDSDWESGAESQPAAAQGHASEGEEMPPVKIIEGKAETDLRQLPKHLREFAKFSNHHREELDGGHREVHEEEERRQEANDNSTSSAIKKSSIVKTYKVSRCPGGGQSQAQLQRAANAAPQSPHMTGASKEEALNGTDAFTSPFFETKFPLPASFSEMFAASPFKSRIYDEFDSYWRNFDFV